MLRKLIKNSTASIFSTLNGNRFANEEGHVGTLLKIILFSQGIAVTSGNNLSNATIDTPVMIIPTPTPTHIPPPFHLISPTERIVDLVVPFSVFFAIFGIPFLYACIGNLNCTRELIGKIQEKLHAEKTLSNDSTEEQSEQPQQTTSSASNQSKEDVTIVEMTSSTINPASEGSNQSKLEPSSASNQTEEKVEIKRLSM